MSTTLSRVVKNFFRIGPREYLKQMNSIGDTKYGTLVGEDAYGNKFYSNDKEDEIHLRTRWVIYKDYYGDMSEVEPAWHGWLGYLVDTPPNKVDSHVKSVRAYPVVSEYWNKTGTNGAYVPYSTVKPKVSAWVPKVAERVAA